jgi:hypothetical protein
MQSPYRVFLVIITLGLASPMVAVGQESPEPVVVHQPPSVGPVPVSVAVYVSDILKIDDANQTLTVDMVVTMRWKDDGLTAQSDGLRVLDAGNIWTPSVQIRNSRSLAKKLRDVVEVDPDGNVTYRQRYFGELSSPLDLADFPLDQHTLAVEFVSFVEDEVEFVPDETRIGQAEEFSIADWRIGSVSYRQRPYEAVGREFHGFVLEFTAGRHIGYYIRKIIFPLAMIVFMSWTVFWIDPSQVAAQLGVASTSMLTMIAYRFALGELIPKVSYLTRLDEFTFSASTLILFALLEAVLTANLSGRGKKALAKRIDRTARWVFPTIFVIIIIRAFWL